MTLSSNFATKMIADICQQMIADTTTKGLPAPTDAQIQLEINRIFNTIKDKSFGNFVLRSGDTFWFVEDLTRTSVTPTSTPTPTPTPILVSALNFNMTVPQGNVALSGTAPIFGSALNKTVAQGNVALSGTAPSVIGPMTVAQGNVALSGTAPSVLGPINRTVPQGNVALSGTAPSILGPINRTVAQGNVALSGTAPSVQVSVKWTPATTGAAALPAGLEIWLPPASGNFTLSGSNITAWNDASGNARNFTLASGATTATFNANALGTGFPGAVPGGGPYRITGQSLPIHLKFFMVAKTSASSVNGGRLVSVVPPTGFDDNNSGLIPLFDDSGNGTSVRMYTPTAASVGTTTSAGSAYLFEALYDGTNAVLWENGTSIGSVSCDMTAFGWSTFDRLAIFGKTNDITTNWLGAMSEFIAYSGSMSATVTVGQVTVTVQQLLEGYLAWNNGQQALLPGGHPYKNGPPLV